MAQIAAALREVTKAYPGTLACRQVSVEFFSGEIHALVGENGAGKSTLVKILAGLLRPDSGTVEIGGQAVRFASPRAARVAGIGVVHQAGSLIETMTVGENLQLGSVNDSPTPDSPEQKELPALPRLGVRTNRLVVDLSPRERRLVEIHRLLARSVNILVLDEPTATLSPQESDLLFRDLRALANTGYTIVVVSHKLPEILTHSDRFTVVRKGRIVARLTRSEASAERLVGLIGGSDTQPREAGQSLSRGRTLVAGAPIVRLHGVSTVPPSPHEAPLHEVDLTLRRGEVLGIAGRPGSGVRTILRTLYGDPVQITRGGVEWLGGSRDVLSIGLVPADRVAAGGVAAFSIANNLALRRRHLLGWQGLVSGRNSLREFAGDLIRRFDIQPPDPRARLENLSGGNVQKVLLAREIEYATDLILAVSPTAGLDIASAAFVWRLLREKAASGTCILVHSDDLDELVGLVDRVAVLSRGRLVGELIGEEITRESVGVALAEALSEPVADPGNLLLQKDMAVCAD